jgi:hypothetical protein
MCPTRSAATNVAEKEQGAETRLERKASMVRTERTIRTAFGTAKAKTAPKRSTGIVEASSNLTLRAYVSMGWTGIILSPLVAELGRGCARPAGRRRQSNSWLTNVSRRPRALANLQADHPNVPAYLPVVLPLPLLQ